MDVDRQGFQQDSRGVGQWELAILTTAGETGRNQLSVGVASSVDSNGQDAARRANWRAYREPSLRNQQRRKNNASHRLLQHESESDDSEEEILQDTIATLQHPETIIVTSIFMELRLKDPLMFVSTAECSGAREGKYSDVSTF
jgi:hypothetical protein